MRSWLPQEVRKNQLPKPNKINGRIYTIRLFLKLWVIRSLSTECVVSIQQAN